MFVFRPSKIKIKKDLSSEKLSLLDSYLNKNSSELAAKIEEVLKDISSGISKKAITEGIANGLESEINTWQEAYADFVNKTLRPALAGAMKDGASRIELDRMGFHFDDSDKQVADWLFKHSSAHITYTGAEARQAVKSVLYVCQQLGMLPKEMAQYIKPIIGLLPRDAVANARYQKKVYDTLVKANPKIKPEVAQRRAAEQALRYAAEQRQRRAEMIANTELAFAYNRGAHEGIRQAVRDGFMGTCVKVWSTAGSRRVCEHCASLNGKQIGFDEPFNIKGRELFSGMHETPPAHPRCRCLVKYVEIEKPVDIYARLKEDMSNQLNLLTSEERDVLRRYTGANAMTLNMALSGPHDKIKNRVRADIKLMDSALGKGVVPRETIVTRRTVPETILPSSSSLKITADNISILKGRIVTTETYISTTFTPWDYQFRNVVIHFKIPAGYRGAMYIRDVAYEKYKFQDEVLICRCMSYKIESVEKKGDLFIINAEVIPR